MENILTITPEVRRERPVIRDFVRRSFRLFLDPVGFFREEFIHLDAAGALAFGLTNGWLAAVAAFFVQTFNLLFFSHLMDRWAQRMLFTTDEAGLFFLPDEKQFMWSAGLLVLAPFLLLFRALLATLTAFVFARLLVTDTEREGADPVTFVNLLRIQAVSGAGRWFRVVPVFGGILSFFVVIVLAVTGIRERFGLSTRRSVAIVLAPYVLLLLAAALLMILFLFALTQFPFQEFLTGDGNDLSF